MATPAAARVNAEMSGAAWANDLPMLAAMPPLVGNREKFPELLGWAGRAQRAHRNMLENLVLFGVLVLVANATGKANATSALGAELFFWSRIAYAAIYLAGIPWARTAASRTITPVC